MPGCEVEGIKWCLEEATMQQQLAQGRHSGYSLMTGSISSLGDTFHVRDDKERVKDGSPVWPGVEGGAMRH